MNAKELREKTEEGLNKELFELLKEQFNLRMQKATGQLKKPHLLREVRKKIARTKTIVAEKAKV